MPISWIWPTKTTTSPLSTCPNRLDSDKLFYISNSIREENSNLRTFSGIKRFVKTHNVLEDLIGGAGAWWGISDPWIRKVADGGERRLRLLSEGQTWSSSSQKLPALEITWLSSPELFAWLKERSGIMRSWGMQNVKIHLSKPVKTLSNRIRKAFVELYFLESARIQETCSPR